MVFLLVTSLCTVVGMKNLSFSPQKITRSGADAQGAVSDPLAIRLFTITRVVLIGVLGLLPLFFIPIAYAPLGYSKVLFVFIGVFSALIFFGLAALRAGRLEFSFSPLLLSMWAIVLVSLISTLFSGDMRDAIVGISFGTQTLAFIALMAFVMTVVGVLGSAKTSVMKFYLVLAGSAIVLSVFHVLRFIFGPEFLSFGYFVEGTGTPLGSWNDLGLFFGLILLLSTVAIELLPLTRIGKIVFGLVSFCSLTILAVVNFYVLWIILGCVSLIMLMYALTRAKFKPQGFTQESNDSKESLMSIGLSLSIFIVSIIFLIAGSSIGNWIAGVTDVQYLEVRPSFEATFNIAKSVYSESAFVGTGPNRFSDAWMHHKDIAINQTIFWNTRFESGIGYIPTLFVTTGILGVLAWVVFLAFVCITGVRIAFLVNHSDRAWYFIGVSSFVASAYLWLMSILYVPGPAMLLLAAVCTGVMLTAYNELIKPKTYIISLLQNRRVGFALVAVVMVVIVGSVTVMYHVSRHYTGLMTFNHAQSSIQAGMNVQDLEQQILEAYELTANDQFAREIARYQLVKMERILNVQQPTEAQAQNFQEASAYGLQAIQNALDLDRTEPENWFVSGRLYSVLAAARVDGARERADEAFNEAQRLDPKNPLYVVAQAQLHAQAGELELAEEQLEKAIKLKRDYTEAYFLLTQLYIAQNDIEGAIEATRATISLEPRNAARYYQLGVLYSNTENTDAAIAAFEAAVRFDQNYANARYLLALMYDSVDRSGEALTQLERVLELNPGNTEIESLITTLREGGSISELAINPTQVRESAAIQSEENVLSPEAPDSPLLSPVNTVGESEAEDVANIDDVLRNTTTTQTATDTEETAVE